MLYTFHRSHTIAVISSSHLVTAAVIRLHQFITARAPGRSRHLVSPAVGRSHPQAPPCPAASARSHWPPSDCSPVSPSPTRRPRSELAAAAAAVAVRRMPAPAGSATAVAEIALPAAVPPRAIPWASLPPPPGPAQPRPPLPLPSLLAVRQPPRSLLHRGTEPLPSPSRSPRLPAGPARPPPQLCHRPVLRPLARRRRRGSAGTPRTSPRAGRPGIECRPSPADTNID